MADLPKIKTELLYERDLTRAASILLEGGVVAFPTETVYGLGACIFMEEAIRKVFAVKGRPQDNPVIAHVSDLGAVETIAQDVPSVFYKLAEKFFPGPLTLVVPKAPAVPSLVSAGLPTIAIRMPQNHLALGLIRLVRQPIVAPSANLSGRPSATDFLHVLEDFDGKIPGLVVGQGADIGIESTVVSLLRGKITLLRPGSIQKEELEEFLGQSIALPTQGGETAPSPGMRYRHYAPDAKVFVFEHLSDAIGHCKNNPDVKRLVLSNEGSPFIDCYMRFPLSPSSFYSRLRQADRCHYEEVLIVFDPLIRKNAGLMNRIEKISDSECVIHCCS